MTKTRSLTYEYSSKPARTLIPSQDEYSYVDVYDSFDEHTGSRLASRQCRHEDTHNDCPGGTCECPCHEPDSTLHSAFICASDPPKRRSPALEKMMIYEVIDLETDECRGEFDSLRDAHGMTTLMRSYAIWRTDGDGHCERVEHCDPYDGDDNRVRQAMGDTPWEQPS